MSDRPPCVCAPRPHRFLSGPLALSLSLAMTAAGCSPGSDSGQGGDGTTSKVPEIAKRQKHMNDMINKAESKEKTPAKPH
jgi:hypothetical protein